MARWRRLLSYAVVFAVGVGGGAGVARWFRPPTRSIEFDMQVDYFATPLPLERLRVEFSEEIDVWNHVELVSEQTPHFRLEVFAAARNTFFLPEEALDSDMINPSNLGDRIWIRLAHPGAFDAVRMNFELETSVETDYHVLQFREREYRIIPVKGMPRCFGGKPEDGAGYMVISTGRFQRNHE